MAPSIYYSTDRWMADHYHLRPYEPVPLPVAVEMAEIVSDACRWFTDPRAVFLGDPDAPAFADEVVDEVCAALQHQLDREGKSRTVGGTCTRHGVKHTDWYHLDQLPAGRRRALVERVWALRARSGVVVTVYEQDGPEPERPATLYAQPGTYPDWAYLGDGA